MPKLQVALSYKYKRKEGHTEDHYKASINIPYDLVKKLGWTKGEELEFEVEANALKIKPKRSILRKQVTNQ